MINWSPGEKGLSYFSTDFPEAGYVHVYEFVCTSIFCRTLRRIHIERIKALQEENDIEKTLHFSAAIDTFDRLTASKVK